MIAHDSSLSELRTLATELRCFSDKSDKNIVYRLSYIGIAL